MRGLLNSGATWCDWSRLRVICVSIDSVWVGRMRVTISGASVSVETAFTTQVLQVLSSVAVVGTGLSETVAVLFLIIID